MATVNISEAARLAGKSRATIQRHMIQGKLSYSITDSGSKCIDISELIRVYGNLRDTHDTCIMPESMMQSDTGGNVQNDTAMRIRLAALEAENAALKDHITSLKQTVLLLENKMNEHTASNIKNPWWYFWRKVK